MHGCALEQWDEATAMANSLDLIKVLVQLRPSPAGPGMAAQAKSPARAG